MDIKQLKKDLKMRPRLISIIGTEEVFIEQAKECIIKEFVSKDNVDFNVNFTLDESPKEIITLLQEMPFGDSDEYKVVFAYDCGRFQSKVPKTSVLVSLDNSIKNPHLTIDCRKLVGRQLISWVTSKAKTYGLTFDKVDSHMFVEMNGNNLQVIDNELLKLSLLGDKSQKALRYLSSANLTSKLDDFTKALATSNTFLALKTYEDLIDLGSSPSSIFGYIVYIFKNLLYVIFLETVEKEESFDTRKFFRFKDKFDYNYISDVLKLLSKVDFDVRNSTFPVSILLIALTKRDLSQIESFINQSTL